MERDWQGTCFVGLQGRFYQDDGLIDPTLRLSSDAPGLTTFGGGASVRWQGPNHGLKLFMGPYISTYEAVDSVLSAYTELYRDRTWLQAHIAWSFQF